MRRKEPIEHEKCLALLLCVEGEKKKKSEGGGDGEVNPAVFPGTKERKKGRGWKLCPGKFQ